MKNINIYPFPKAILNAVFALLLLHSIAFSNRKFCNILLYSRFEKSENPFFIANSLQPYCKSIAFLLLLYGQKSDVF